MLLFLSSISQYLVKICQYNKSEMNVFVSVYTKHAVMQGSKYPTIKSQITVCCEGEMTLDSVDIKTCLINNMSLFPNLKLNPLPASAFLTGFPIG